MYREMKTSLGRELASALSPSALNEIASWCQTAKSIMKDRGTSFVGFEDDVWIFSDAVDCLLALEAASRAGK